MIAAARRLAAPRRPHRPRPRRAAHRRRSADRFRPDRPHLCLSKRIRRAGPDGPGQGHDRRLPADGAPRWPRRPIFNAFLGRLRRVQDLLPRPQLHRQPTGRRRLAGQPAPARIVRLSSARAICCKNRWPSPCKPYGPCPTSATSAKWASSPASNWSRIGRRAQPFAPRERIGIRVCEAMARRGVLTRPVGDVIVLMPPYCTTPAQVRVHGRRPAPERGGSLRVVGRISLSWVIAPNLNLNPSQRYLKFGRRGAPPSRLHYGRVERRETLNI